MNQPTISVNRFKNRNGTFAWRVDGRINGVRIRRNFKTPEEAAAEKAAVKIKAEKAATGLNSVITPLTEAQVREAETLFRRVDTHGRSLAFCVDYTFANYRDRSAQKPLTEAVTDYLARKRQEQAQDMISAPHLVRIERDLKRLQKHFPGAVLTDLAGAKLVGYFEARDASLKTYNNRRGVVSTFLKYALQREWITDNPLVRIPSLRIRRRRVGAATLTAQQAQDMMAFVEEQHPSAVPFFVLCLFVGIRPCLRTGEITRLRPEHFKLDEALLRVGGEVSKVREPRNVTLQSNVVAWLKAYPLEKFPILPKNLQHTREKVVAKFNLTHDILRHTFISMFVAKFRSLGEAALQAGNSEAIIRKHYLDLKGKEEAEQFWNIRPKRQESPAAAPVLALPWTPAALPVAI